MVSKYFGLTHVNLESPSCDPTRNAMCPNYRARAERWSWLPRSELQALSGFHPAIPSGSSPTIPRQIRLPESKEGHSDAVLADSRIEGHQIAKAADKESEPTTSTSETEICVTTSSRCNEKRS